MYVVVNHLMTQSEGLRGAGCIRLVASGKKKPSHLHKNENLLYFHREGVRDTELPREIPMDVTAMEHAISATFEQTLKCHTALVSFAVFVSETRREIDTRKIRSRRMETSCLNQCTTGLLCLTHKQTLHTPKNGSSHWSIYWIVWKLCMGVCLGSEVHRLPAHRLFLVYMKQTDHNQRRSFCKFVTRSLQVLYSQLPPKQIT
jgi:hypothetical protein